MGHSSLLARSRVRSNRRDVQHSSERAHSERLALEQLQRNEKILNEIHRGLNPLADVRVRFVFAPERLEEPACSSYLRRLEKEIARFLRFMKSKSESSIQGTEPIFAERPNGSGGDVVGIIIRKNSPLFPSRDTETVAYDKLTYHPTELLLYKTPVGIDRVPYATGFPGTDIKFPDIIMSFGKGPTNEEDFELSYDLRDKKFMLAVDGLTSDPKDWNSSGKIASTLDLPGAQLFARYSLAPNWRSRELDVMVLQINSQEGLYFPRDKLTVYSSEFVKVYEYTFPTSY